jgi:hypothetical protein
VEQQPLPRKKRIVCKKISDIEKKIQQKKIEKFAKGESKASQLKLKKTASSYVTRRRSNGGPSHQAKQVVKGMAGSLLLHRGKHR